MRKVLLTVGLSIGLLGCQAGRTNLLAQAQQYCKIAEPLLPLAASVPQAASIATLVNGVCNQVNLGTPTLTPENVAQLGQALLALQQLLTKGN